MYLIDGKKIAEEILIEAKSKLQGHSVRPKLAIIYIGDDSSSATYVQKKINAGEIVGVDVIVHRFHNTSAMEVTNLITQLNTDKTVHGIIVQLPVKEFDINPSLAMIAAEKDVDCLNPISLGRLWHNQQNAIIPATPHAIIKVLAQCAKQENFDLQTYLTGKNVLIINRSIIIGKPIAAILLNYNATITIAHSYTKNLQDAITKADIIITGTGSQTIFADTQNLDKKVLIDCAFVRDENGIHGDVKYQQWTNSDVIISPVPNGIGPIGVACLIANTVECAASN